MGKRANNQTAAQSPKRTNKKAKVDPVLASISAVIMQADDLPDKCRTMLVDMLPFSLSAPADKRREAQAWAVDAVEQTLGARRTSLEAAVATGEAKLADLRESGTGLSSKVQEAEAALNAQNEVLQTAKSVLAERLQAANTARDAFLAAQAEQKTGEAKLASTQEEKVALETAFEANFQAPMRDGSGPHFFELTPFIKQIEMEGSLLKALPSSCEKAKADRGSFDEVVLQELEKALSTKMATLGKAVEAETLASGERDAAVKAAEKTDSEKQEEHKQATETFDSAQKEQTDRETALTEAKRHVDELQPQVDAATGSLEKARKAFANFEAGPLSNFNTYKNRVEASAEAAPAGA